MNPLGDGTQRYGLYDQALQIPAMYVEQLKYTYSMAKAVIPSPSAEQAHRKHFGLRKHYGITD